MCNKVPYDSRQAARDAAQGIGRKKGVSMEEYLCREGCGKWHLATRGKNSRKKKMRQRRSKDKYKIRYSTPLYPEKKPNNKRHKKPNNKRK